MMMRLLPITLAFASYQTNALNQITQMGVCENLSDGTLRCAMQSSDCNPSHINGATNVEGEKYLGVHQQRLEKKDLGCQCKDTPAHLCLTPSADDPTHFIKTCVSDLSSCDLNNGSLLGSGDDTEEHCTCAHVMNTVDDGNPNADTVQSPTLYGACKNRNTENDFFCAFKSADCEVPYVWVRPQDTQDAVGTQCTCDKVRTGACVSGFTGTVCSVSAEACSNGWGIFKRPITLKKQHGESCRLCSASTPDLALLPDAIDSVKQRVQLFPIIGGSFAGILLLLGFFMCFKRWKSGKSLDTMNKDEIEDGTCIAESSPDPSTTVKEIL